MSRHFGAPEWLALLPLLGFAAWYWPRLGLRQPLRIGCLALLALALALPRLSHGGRGLDLWVLEDQSASARELLEPQRRELESLLERAKRLGDRIFYVDYADQALLRTQSGETLPGSRQRTRTAGALQFILGQLDSTRPARILLLGDGYATEPLTGIAERLRAQAVPLDLRLLVAPAAADYRADVLLAPARVAPGEPFLLELRLSGAPERELPVVVERDGVPIGRAQAQLENGAAVVRLRDRIARPGAYRYSAELTAHDAHPGNNRAQAWVEVSGGARVLLVSAYRDDPLAAVLLAQGFEVQTVTDLRRLGVGDLTGTRAVVLDNVPAYALPSEFVAALDGFVRVQGGGLLMAGGKTSFAAGGYAGSPIDALLPVSMELRQEHRKLAVALAIVLDRSGSMAAAVGPGVTKMDLANEGAARSIALLGDHDGVAVLAVDSEAHRVVPLSDLGAERGRVIDMVRRIQSGGGGIYVGVGLAAGLRELQQAPQGQRHLILFADAADSEEPGDYPRLVAELVRGGASISVIGLGSERDSDAALLKDIARLGKGRMFFVADPATLPAVFAQETVAVARSAFIDDVTGVRPAAGFLEIAAQAIDGLADVDGYNLSYLRPEATAAAFSKDAYQAPLVAFWQRGSGRVAAVSFPLGGEHSARVRAWPGYGDFVQTLVRYLRGADAPAGIGLQTRLEGTELRLDLRFDRGWEERLAARPPRILLVEGVSGGVQEPVWERLAPGHFGSRVPLAADQFYRGAVDLAGATLRFGPIEAPGGAEWAFDPERLRELRVVVAQSGGQERTDVARIFESAPFRAPRDLRPWIWAGCLLLMLAEALRARAGWDWRLPRRLHTAARADPPPAGSTAALHARESISEAVAPPTDASRAERFRRAKRERR